MTKRLNVRCCCQPTKVLGTVEVPSHLGQGQEVIWAYCINDAESIRQEAIELPLDVLHNPAQRTRELAVKAEGMEVEELRKIPSFRAGDFTSEYIMYGPRKETSRRLSQGVRNPYRRYEASDLLDVQHPEEF